jgi:putative transcriptional regulator
MIRHHPSETTLVAYASGSLPEALGLVLASHLVHCHICRDALAELEAVGGALLDGLPPAPLNQDPGMIDRLLARADTPLAAQPPVLNPDLDPPLNRVKMGRWWPIGRGIQWRPLRVTGGAWAGLIHAQPGRTLPSHGHDGLELTCLLTGAFRDDGDDYYAGDLSEPGGDHDHPPVVIGPEPCLCVIASEGMRLRGVLGLAQRMAGL